MLAEKIMGFIQNWSMVDKIKIWLHLRDTDEIKNDKFDLKSVRNTEIVGVTNQ